MANICEVELSAKGKKEDLELFLNILERKEKRYGEVCGFQYNSDLIVQWNKDKTFLTVYTGCCWGMGYVFGISTFDFEKFSRDHRIDIEMMTKEGGTELSEHIYIKEGVRERDEIFKYSEICVSAMKADEFVAWAKKVGYTPATTEEYQAILDCGEDWIEFTENPEIWEILE